jgi:hypothetical protein
VTGGLSAFHNMPNTNTSPPANNEVRVNNLTMASATHVFVSKTDRNAADCSPVLSQLVVGTEIKLFREAAPSACYLLGRITAVSDQTTWVDYTITNLGGAGTTNNGVPVAMALTFAPTGATGPSGPSGPSGPAGSVGTTGIAGPTGPSGPSGPTGPQGLPFTWRGGWATATAYVVGNAVTDTGPAGVGLATYTCLSAHTSTSVNRPSANGVSLAIWDYVVIGPSGPSGPSGPAGIAGPTGPSGAQGIHGLDGADGNYWYSQAGPPPSGGLNGDYSLNLTNGDVYQKQGASWVLLGNIKGPTGTTGPTGPSGPTGTTGAVGATGPSGPTGAAGPITSGIHPDNMVPNWSFESWDGVPGATTPDGNCIGWTNFYYGGTRSNVRKGTPGMDATALKWTTIANPTVAQQQQMTTIDVIPVQPGQVWYICAWARSGDAANPIQLQLYTSSAPHNNPGPLDGASHSLTAVAMTTVGTTTWTLYEGQVTIPAGDFYMRPFYFMNAPATSGPGLAEGWLDFVQARLVTPSNLSTPRMPAPYYARLTRTTSVNIASGGTYQTAFETATFDANMQQPGWSSAGFTVPAPGLYVVEGHLDCVPTATGGRNQLSITKNGTAQTGAVDMRPVQVAGTFRQTIAALVPCVAGDVIGQLITIFGVAVDTNSINLTVTGPMSSGPPGPAGPPLTTTPWTGLTYVNGWADYGAPFQPGQYRKVGDEVQVRGLVQGGTINAPIAVLPVGFRPPNDELFPCVENTTVAWNTGAASTGTAHTHPNTGPPNVAARVTVIASTGAITPPNTAGNGYIDLVAIRFSTST